MFVTEIIPDKSIVLGRESDLQRVYKTNWQICDSPVKWMYHWRYDIGTLVRCNQQ